ncbi:serine--tRNA ligase [Candidatus Nomurabacteria bacterium]|nr:serine--tRNA ligase [Candidatus Nomurabacteria bacterium]
MLDIKFIKENKDLVQKNNQSRGVKVDIDQLLDVYEERNVLLKKVEEKRSLRKQESKTKPSPEIIAKMKMLGEELKTIEEELKDKEQELNLLLWQIPNINMPDVPLGGEENTKVEKTIGKIPSFDFPVQHHADLGQNLDLIDLEQGAVVSGARFWYLKNELVELQFALMQFVWSKLIKKGFKPLAVPHLVKEEAMFGTGFFPAEKNEIYNVNQEEDNLYLIGTAEVPLISFHAGQTLDLKEAKKYFAFTPAYRREAGSYGKDTKGILRGHQFDKIEMVIFCRPEESQKYHQEILSIEEEIWQELKIPYQVVNIASGDLGAPAAKKYDIEAWLPAQNTYREVTSCSNTTDFQSRRLQIKYEQDNKKELVHTLNGTGMAFGRALIAVMENYQNAKGEIEVPKVLQKYLSFKKIKKEK